MALVAAHGNPIATASPVPAQAPAAGQPLIDKNQLRTAFRKQTFPLLRRLYIGQSQFKIICLTELGLQVIHIHGQMKQQ